MSQQLEALRLANMIRSDRAKTKRRLKSRELDPRKVLLDEVPPHLQTMRVRDFLVCLPMVRQVKADRVLRRCRISMSLRLGELSQGRRAQLLTELERCYPAALRKAA